MCCSFIKNYALFNFVLKFNAKLLKGRFSMNTNNQLRAPSFEVISFLPKNFFNKKYNEDFIHLVMKSILGEGEWKSGDPNKKEPDYIFNNVPFEFTLASDKCNNNFINRLRTFTYTTNSTEDDAISYIEQQIKSKSDKRYSLPNVHLCVLCLIELFDWISDESGSCTHYLIDYKREQFFNNIKTKYIGINGFSNIFIIFPDMYAKWWVWDVLSDSKVSLFVHPKMIESKKYPFFIEERLYKQLIDAGLLLDKFKN